MLGGEEGRAAVASLCKLVCPVVVMINHPTVLLVIHIYSVALIKDLINIKITQVCCVPDDGWYDSRRSLLTISSTSNTLSSRRIFSRKWCTVSLRMLNRDSWGLARERESEWVSVSVRVRQRESRERVTQRERKRERIKENKRERGEEKEEDDEREREVVSSERERETEQNKRERWGHGCSLHNHFFKYTTTTYYYYPTISWLRILLLLTLSTTVRCVLCWASAIVRRRNRSFHNNSAWDEHTLYKRRVIWSWSRIYFMMTTDTKSIKAIINRLRNNIIQLWCNGHYQWTR